MLFYYILFLLQIILDAILNICTMNLFAFVFPFFRIFRSKTKLLVRNLNKRFIISNMSLYLGKRFSMDR